MNMYQLINIHVIQVQVQVEFIITHAGVKIISAVSYYTCT